MSKIENNTQKEIHNEDIADTSIESWMQIMYDDIIRFFNTDDSDEIIPIIRVVHDGGIFGSPVRANPENISQLESLVKFAPLHMPLALRAIELCKKLFSKHGDEPWLVFDTHFHQSLPRVARATGLPRSIEDRLGIRRYGFHGLSHQYTMQQITQRAGSKHAILSCHLGSGASVCAIENTHSIEVSMGSGPGTGVVMGTRSGTVDWEALLYLMEQDQLKPAQVRTLLYQHSGILGITQHTGLMPDLLAVPENPLNQEAIEQFVYSVVKTISSYIPLFATKPTHIVFTGGIGTGSHQIRRLILDRFALYHWNLNISTNERVGDAGGYFELQDSHSDITIITMPADEESIMVQEVRAAELG